MDTARVFVGFRKRTEATAMREAERLGGGKALKAERTKDGWIVTVQR